MLHDYILYGPKTIGYHESAPFVFHELGTSSSSSNGISLPLVEDKGHDEKSVILYGDIYYKVSRSIPSGYIDLYFRDNEASSWQKMPTSLEWRKDTYPMLIFKGENRTLYLVSYDVVGNTPSGRRLTGIKTGFDLYKITLGAKITKKIASSISLGGIDEVLYSSYNDGNVYICGDAKCLTIDGQGDKKLWSIDYIRDYEFVEVSFHGNKAAALLRKKYDDRFQGELTEEYSSYYFAVFDIEGAVTDLVKATGIPYELRWNDGQPEYKRAKNPRDYIDVLFYDISRMPINGTMEFGANNLEGRIAWRQVYYLHGMLSLLSNQTESLYLSDAQKNKLRERASQELQLVEQLCKTGYPGYKVKRYSIDREPLLFALHLGRISSLLSRAKKIGIVDSEECINSLVKQMRSLENTVESRGAITVEKNKLNYMFYKRGYPFWADGANVPYNYTSGIVDGILSSVEHSDASVAEMMRPLILNEFNGDLKIWRYWFGFGDDGWDESSNLSLNTPAYSGNKKSLAHITYRTIDAKAILQAEKNNPNSKLAIRVHRMVEEGLVLPDVNEYLYELNGIADISYFSASRYSRSNSAWQIQSQVWALNQLSRDSGH